MGSVECVEDVECVRWDRLEWGRVGWSRKGVRKCDKSGTGWGDLEKKISSILPSIHRYFYSPMYYVI